MKKVDILYYIAIFGIFCISLIDISRIIELSGTYRTIIYALIITLLIVKIMFTKYSKNQVILMAILGIVSMYTTYKLRNYMFITNFLAIVGIKGVKINSIVKIDIAVKLFFLILHTANYIYQFGNIINISVLIGGDGIRHSLYFSHPNTVAGLVVWLAIDMLYISKKKLKTYIFTTIMMIVYYTITISRTALIIYVLFSIMLLISEVKSEAFQKNTNFLVKYLIDIFAITTIILVILPNIIKNTTFIEYIDTTLSGRLFYSQWALDLYGFNLLPNVATIVLERFLIIDNFYIRCFVSYGLITYVMLSAKYKLIPKSIQNIDRVVLLILPFYLFNELFCYNVGRAIPLLILANVIFNSKEQTKMKNIKKENMLVTKTNVS